MARAVTSLATGRALGSLEREALAKANAARRRPRVRIDGTRLEIISPSNGAAPDLGQAKSCAALGSGDVDFVSGLLNGIANIRDRTKSDDADITAEANFVLAVVNGMQPKDEAEAMLATQMAVIHRATMKYARRLEQAAGVEQSDVAERALNRLSRTYAAQMEALKRYRSDGGQNVTVKHVHVHQGGQAIVGNVGQGGRGRSKNAEITR